MKIDRKFYDQFEETIKKDNAVREHYERGDIKAAEEYIRENLFDKPEEFFNLEKLRKEEYARLATNPKVTIADLKDLEEWRNVIPEYVKDYVSLNTFM